MPIHFKRLVAFAVACAPALVSAAHAQGYDTANGASPQSTQQRLDELKSTQKELEQLLRDNDARIRALETEVNGREPGILTPTTEQPHAAAPAIVQNVPQNPVPAPQKSATLNYTDSFGRTFTLDRRQDVMLNKVSMTFKGWLLDPNFTYNTFVWTQNSSQGLAAQVEVAGHLSYRFNDAFTLASGVAPLPTTRSTNWTYPMWLRNDNRTLADEYFRGNFTFGIWANGKLGSDVGYRVMVGNNLNQIGVDDTQIDANFSTVSAALWWMPTTGEYGPSNGFGDLENHQKLATLLGVHFTYSPEDKQEQANVNAFENSQIRLSDGTLFFSPNAFNTGGEIDKAHYQMLDLDAGLKYRGWSLEGEYYARWLTNFEITGIIPVTSLFDQGFQIQASTMLIQKQLQLYFTGSQVFGGYGNPWDVSAGLNWYPFLRHEVRLNSQLNYVSHSPVGNLSITYAVGGTGWIFNNDVIIAF